MPRDASRVAGRDLEHERAAFPEDVARAPRDRFGRPVADERLARLPVAHLRLERVDLVGQHVRRIRHDEIPRPVRKPAIEIPLDATRSRGPSARRSRRRPRARPPRRRSRSRERRDARPRWRARSRRSPCPRRARAARAQPASRARHRSTTTSVSGRGTSTRRSTASVSRRKPHSPRTYASGSRAPRRTTSRSSSCSSSRESLRRLERELRACDAEHVGDEDLGVDARCVAAEPAARRSVVSASARPTFTPKRRRAPVAAPRRAAPRSARPGRRRAPGRGGAASA